MTAAPSIRGPWRSLGPAAIALVMLGLVAGAYWLGGRAGGRTAPPIAFGQSIKVTWDPGLEILPAISPDVSHVSVPPGWMS